MRKYLVSLLSLIFFSLNIYPQTSTSIEVEAVPIENGTIATVVDKMNEADVSHLFTYFIIIIIVVILGLFIIHKIFNYIFNKVEDLKVGPISFKMKKKDGSFSHRTRSNRYDSLNFNTIMNIFELVTRNQIKVIINDTISSLNEIHSIEDDYDKNVKSVFEKTFSVIERDLHDKLVTLACEVTKFDLMKVKNTREYFFISDLLQEYNKVWMDDAKEITRRNGFVEFLNDRSKAEPYINELANAINQCIDMGKLESTDIPKSSIDNIIKNSYKDYHMTLENMFYNLATLKSKMFLKRDAKLSHIDDIVNNTSTKIVEDIKTHVFRKFTSNEDDNRADNGLKEEEKN